MKLEYSQQDAIILGYTIAKLQDGKEVKYTSYISDENDKPNTQASPGSKDKVTVYQGKNSDIVSNDYTNNLSVPAGALLGSPIGKGNGRKMATIVGNILAVRLAATQENTRLENEVKNILKK